MQTIDQVILENQGDVDKNRVEQLANDSVDFGRKVTTGVQIFSQNFMLVLHRDSLVLVAAPSGRGKSTFAIQVAAHAIFEKRRVLILSNEMNRLAYIERVGRIYANISGNMLPREGIVHCLKERLLYIEDIDSSAGKTAAFDALPGFALAKIELIQPDLVLIDQISCAVNALDQTKYGRVDTYLKLTSITRSINRRINANMGLPPILLFQQALDSPGKDRKPGTIDMQSNLRGSKDTFNDATHAIYIERNSDNVTTLSVQKQRYASPHKRVSDWVMNANGILVPFILPTTGGANE